MYRINNLLRISRKEFVDLLSSPMVIVITAGFLIIIAVSLVNLNSVVSGVVKNGIGTRLERVDSFGLFFSDWLFMNLIGFYGPVVGIMIGSSSIASERHKDAIRTLLVKPVYRDTIINGKILGSLSFLAIIILSTMTLYTAILLMLYGNLIAPTLGDYITRMPIIFLFAIVFISIFITISMLVSLLIKSQAFALIISLIILYLFNIMGTYGFAGVLGNMFPGEEIVVENFIAGLTPTGFLITLRASLFNSSSTVFNSLVNALPELLKFLLFTVIATVACYIVFIRRDEA